MVKKKSTKKSSRQRRFHWPQHTVAYAALVVIGLALLGYLYSVRQEQVPQDARLVTIYDRGERKVILTIAQTVNEALNDAKITIDRRDAVEPSVNEQLRSADSAIIIYRARPVLIIDGNVRQKVITPAQSPNGIVAAAHMKRITNKDKTAFKSADFVTHGANRILEIDRAGFKGTKVVYVRKPNALTVSKGAQIYVDSDGVAHRETYYDLPMNVVINACGQGNSYTIRPQDGAKIDKDGYVLVAANYGNYPRCSVVETSLGPGKVYDTGGFALRYPHGFDLATDWSYGDGI